MAEELNETNAAEIIKDTINELETNEVKDTTIKVKSGDFKLKNNKSWLFKKGNKLSKGRPKNKPFSLKEDLIKSLKRIKAKNKALYQQIIDSYWTDKGMRPFLMEQIDGKARQSTEIVGSLENPIRIIEVKEQKKEENEAK